MKLLAYLKYAGKSVVAGTIAFAGAAAVATADGSGISQNEFWITLGATVLAIGGVFGFTNGAKPQG